MTCSENQTDDELSAKLAACFASDEENYPHIAAAYVELIARLEAAGVGESAPRAGDLMPDIALPDSHGRIVRLSELAAKGPVVVSFNRGHWCPFCRTELDMFQQEYSAILAKGAQFVSIMPDTAGMTEKMRIQNGYDFPILTDLDNGYALQLNLAIALGPLIKSQYLELGIDLGKSQRNDGWLIPVPATVVVAPDMMIVAAYAKADFSKRMEPAAVLDVLEGLTQPN